MLQVSVVIIQYNMCYINPSEWDLGISCNIIACRLYSDMYVFNPADGALIASFIIKCIDWPSFSSDTSLILIHASSQCVGFISFAVFYSKHSYFRSRSLRMSALSRQNIEFTYYLLYFLFNPRSRKTRFRSRLNLLHRWKKNSLESFEDDCV